MDQNEEMRQTLEALLAADSSLAFVEDAMGEEDAKASVGDPALDPAEAMRGVAQQS